MREGPGVNTSTVRPSLSFISTENPGGSATTLVSVAKTQAYEKVGYPWTVQHGKNWQGRGHVFWGRTDGVRAT